ncbi:MAG: hypothetical protein KDD33_12065 [Bdellovibrionales bacterium]|nr:hypothetical protein [Bdellovibrionales bacterium]
MRYSPISMIVLILFSSSLVFANERPQCGKGMYARLLKLNPKEVVSWSKEKALEVAESLYISNNANASRLGSKLSPMGAEILRSTKAFTEEQLTRFQKAGITPALKARLLKAIETLKGKRYVDDIGGFANDRNHSWLRQVGGTHAPLSREQLLKYFKGDSKMVNLLLENPQKLKALGRNNEYRFEGIRMSSYERARNFMMDFPLFDTKGFKAEFASSRVRNPYVCRLPSSPFNGKTCGWEVHGNNGFYSRLRLDHDEVHGGHFNLEIQVMETQGNGQIKKVSYRYAIPFDCGGHTCTAREAERLRRKAFSDRSAGR